MALIDANQATVTSLSELILSDGNQEDGLDKGQKKEELKDDIHLEINNTSKSEEKKIPPAYQNQFSNISAYPNPPPKKPSVFATEWKMIIFLSILFCIMIVGVSLIYHFYKIMEYEFEVGRTIHFDEITRKLDVYNEKKEKVLEGVLGKTLPPGMLPYECNKEMNDNTHTCIAWKDKAKFEVFYSSNSDHVNCYKMTWQSFDQAYYPYDCFRLGDAHWFGGIMANRAEFNAQHISRRPFLTSTTNGVDHMGSVIEPYWLTSKGLAIFVEGEYPLHLSVNVEDVNNKTIPEFCLMSQYENSPYHNPMQQMPQLNYSICSGNNALDVHKFVIDTFFSPSRTILPDVKIFSTPIYSTWAKFKSDIDQQKIDSYVESLKKGTNSTGMIVFQEGWQTKHGDIEFDPQKFPNASGMVSNIRSKGFDAGITVTHMVATDSQRFQQGVDQNFLVKDAGNAAPGLVQYWTGPHLTDYYGGYTAAMDFFLNSNIPFTKVLNRTSLNYYIQYLSFEGGQSDVLPFHPTFTESSASPNLYLNTYSSFASSTVQYCPVQAAYRNQNLTVFVQLYDFNSMVERDQNGIKSLIPAVISVGLMGYPFIIPGAIGGSSYGNLPTKNLYIRWAQLNTFLPVMHFSIPSTDYDQETIDIVNTLTELHNSYVIPKIQEILEDATAKFYPLIRPLWWLDPLDGNCYAQEDEFLLGDKVLVAPIVEQDKQERDVYLPQGNWLDKLTGRTEVGPTVLTNYPVPLKNIAYFELQT